MGFTRAELIAPVKRWTFARKLTLLHGVRLMAITKKEAVETHELSVEEFDGWCFAYERYGANGLRSSAPGLRRAS